MKVTMKPVIDIKDICEEMCIHMSGFEFVQDAENDSYISLNLNEEAFEDLQEEIEWEDGKSLSRLERLKNQYRLMRMLYKTGYVDEVLIYVNW